jgi:membrane-associated phospholipid phosphatase
MRKVSRSLNFLCLVLWLSFTIGNSFGQVEPVAVNEASGQLTGTPGSDSKSSTPADASLPDSTPSSSNENGPQPAQGIPPPPKQSAFREFVGTFLADEKAIWTSPLHAKPKDLQWLVPLAATTGVLFATDTDISNGLPNSNDQIKISKWVSHLGAAYSLYGATGAFYLIGRLKDNDRLRETGWVGLMAVVHSQIVVAALKLATGRERPDENEGQGRFWKGKDSFASGHAISSWALASVVAREYDDHKLIQIGAYSLAAIVSASRVTARRHFPSDVVAGGAMGFLIGRYMVRAHQGTSDFTGQSKLKTLLSPQAAPCFDRRSKTYGLALNWNF